VRDGWSATRALRARGVRTLIVGLTANVDEATQAGAVAAGMDAVYAKPLLMCELDRLLQLIHARRCLRHQADTASTDSPGDGGGECVLATSP